MENGDVHHPKRIPGNVADGCNFERRPGLVPDQLRTVRNKQTTGKVAKLNMSLVESVFHYMKLPTAMMRK